MNEKEFVLYFFLFSCFILRYDIIYIKLRIKDINIQINFIIRKASSAKKDSIEKKS